MRIRKSTTSKKKAVTLVVVVLAVAGLSIFAWFSPDVPFFGIGKSEDGLNNTVDYDGPNAEQQDAGTKIKEDFVDKKYQQDSSEETLVDTPVDMSFSSVSQLSDRLSIRVIIQSNVMGGTCELTALQGDSVITKVVQTQIIGSYKTCQGFDIPLNELSSGSWKVSVAYIDDSGVRSVIDKQVRINE